MGAISRVWQLGRCDLAKAKVHGIHGGSSLPKPSIREHSHCLSTHFLISDLAVRSVSRQGFALARGEG